MDDGGQVCQVVDDGNGVGDGFVENGRFFVKLKMSFDMFGELRQFEELWVYYGL